MMTMKQFDWGLLRLRSNPQKALWLELNANKKVSEAEYVAAMKQLQQYSKAKQRSNKYAPSSLRRSYQHLTNTYGFFQGT